MALFSRDVAAPRFVDAGQVAVERQADPAMDFSALIKGGSTLVSAFMKNQDLKKATGQVNKYEEDLEKDKAAIERNIKTRFDTGEIDAEITKIQTGLERGIAEGSLSAEQQETMTLTIKQLEQFRTREKLTESAFRQESEQRFRSHAKLRASAARRELLAENPELFQQIASITSFGVFGEAVAGETAFDSSVGDNDPSIQLIKQVALQGGLNPDLPLSEVIGDPRWKDAYADLKDLEEATLQQKALERAGLANTAEHTQAIAKQIPIFHGQILSAKAKLAAQVSSGAMSVEEATSTLQGMVGSLRSQAAESYYLAPAEMHSRINSILDGEMSDFVASISLDGTAGRYQNEVDMFNNRTMRELQTKNPELAQKLHLLVSTLGKLPAGSLSTEIAKKLASGAIGESLMLYMSGQIAPDEGGGRHAGDLAKRLLGPNMTPSQKQEVRDDIQKMSALLASEAYTALPEDAKNTLQGFVSAISQGLKGEQVPKAMSEAAIRMAAVSVDRLKELTAGVQGTEGLKAAGTWLQAALTSKFGDAMRQVDRELGGGSFLGIDAAGVKGFLGVPTVAQHITYSVTPEGALRAINRNTAPAEFNDRVEKAVAVLNSGPMEAITNAFRANAHIAAWRDDEEPDYVRSMAQFIEGAPELNRIPNLNNAVTEKLRIIRSEQAGTDPRTDLFGGFTNTGEGLIDQTVKKQQDLDKRLSDALELQRRQQEAFDSGL